jgi:hypothetical protein
VFVRAAYWYGDGEASLYATSPVRYALRATPLFSANNDDFRSIQYYELIAATSPLVHVL